MSFFVLRKNTINVTQIIFISYFLQHEGDMKIETATTILDYIADFVDKSPRDPINEQRVMVLIDLLAGANISCSLRQGDDMSEEHIVAFHELLTSYLESLSHGGEVGCSLNKEGVMITASFSSPLPGPHLDLSNAGTEGFIFAMLYLFAIADVKELFRCPSCGLYVFRTGRSRKYCSNRCKQRAYVTRQTPEEKEAIRKTRKEDYKRKVLRGGG